MKAAIMGYGTIGSGVYTVLEKNREIIREKTGEPIEVKYVLDLRDFPGDPAEKKLVHDVSVIVSDPEIGIVVETMGGTDPAFRFVKSCLLAGKHVVTSNKELVAAHGTELFAIANKNRVRFLFEASAGGGIPIIRALNGGLAGEEIVEIYGILNGTTNYILTKMRDEGSSFEEALRMAQEQGYAERNPAADIEGYDTCRKVAILTAVISGHEVDCSEIPVEGITKITGADFRYAARMDASIKLLGRSRKKAGTYYLEVAPALIGRTSPLSNVDGVFNGIVVVGNMLGKSMFYGSGAGKLPTASAVVGDMIAAVRHGVLLDSYGWDGERLKTRPASELPRQYFARFAGSRAEKEDGVSTAFGQVEWLDSEESNEFAFLSPAMTGAEFEAAAEKVGGLRQKIAAEL